MGTKRGEVMAWGLSHTAEAYANADANIRRLPLRTLRDCAISWKQYLRAEGLKPYNFNVRKLDRESLADYVSEHALS